MTLGGALSFLIVGSVEPSTIKSNRRRGPDTVHSCMAVKAHRITSFSVDRTLNS